LKKKPILEKILEKVLEKMSPHARQRAAERQSGNAHAACKQSG